MKIKNLFPAVAILLLLHTSCSKTYDGAGGTTTIAEKNMPNVSYGTDAQQKMDIFLPANRTTATTKVMILIHGGAWTTGDKTDFTVYMDTLKKRIPDYAIFNINYRLAVAFPTPANAFPAQELDVKTAVEFIYGNRASYLISDKFVLMGASAGGHLAMLQSYKYTSTVKIKAVVDFFGPTNMVTMFTDNPPTQPALTALLSGTPTTNPTMYFQSSPLNFVVSTSCPTIILQGTADPLVNANTQSIALRDKLTLAGVVNQYVPYVGLGHGDTWPVATYTDAFNKIGVFLAANVQ